MRHAFSSEPTMTTETVGFSSSSEHPKERLAPSVSHLEMWRALKSRNYHYDGMFVFGVGTTGIYCRPSCPARHPGRTHVVYFATPDEAEKSGFRPCKRCRPNDAAFVSLQKRRIQDLCAFITENLDRKVDLAELGRRINLSPFHLQRLFKRMLGITPRQYAEAARVERVKIALKKGDPVRNAIYGSGRGSTSWLYSDPFSKLGMSPSAYKSRGKGMCIFYFTTECSMGRLLIAGTDKGVCAVSLGDSDEGLAAFLMSEYPAARIERDRRGRLHSWTNAISRYLDGNDVVPIQDLPLDIQATSFQYRVWKELQSIPYGSVCTYDEIAERISCPQGARAVANACANNKASLIIPCHRVVRKDGSLGGYRWGVERKTSLLQHEKENLAKKAVASNANRTDSQPILRVARGGTPLHPDSSRKAVARL